MAPRLLLDIIWAPETPSQSSLRQGTYHKSCKFRAVGSGPGTVRGQTVHATLQLQEKFVAMGTCSVLLELCGNLKEMVAKGAQFRSEFAAGP